MITLLRRDIRSDGAAIIRGMNFCIECPDFPCDLLKTHPGVIKFHCIENLIEIREKGLEYWIDKQWRDYIRSMLSY